MSIFFSVFTGVIYEIEEEFTDNLDCGQLEITNHPKRNCKKCYGRGYTHKNLKTDHYSLCNCTMKEATPTMLKVMSEHQVEDVTLHTKKSDFDSIVSDIYS